VVENVVKEAAALGLGSAEVEDGIGTDDIATSDTAWIGSDSALPPTNAAIVAAAAAPAPSPEPPKPAPVQHIYKPNFSLQELHEALEVVRQLDPPGVGCRDLRECLLAQLKFHQQQLESGKHDVAKNGNGNGNGDATAQVLADAVAVVDQHLRGLQM